MIVHFCNLIGYVPAFMSQSAADQKLGRAGDRKYFWAKDLGCEARLTADEFDLAAYIDVDYYVDMPSLLSEGAKPVAMYTFVPTGVAKSTGEYSFNFDKDNKVCYKVCGGAEYSHQLWNYGNDVIVANGYTWYGFKQSTAYNVERRQIDEHHQLILLVPLFRTVCPFIHLTDLVSGNTLQRLNVTEEVDGTCYTRLDVQGPDGLIRHTGIAGTYLDASLAAQDDDGLAIAASVSKTDINMASVKVHIKESDPNSAAVLVSYHRSTGLGRKPDTIFPVAHSVNSYQFTGLGYDQDCKDSVKPFMNPIDTDSFAPDQSPSNDKMAVDGRVNDVKNPPLEISATMIGYMDEFAKMLVPVANIGHPVDFDEVFDRQGRPSQRRLFEQGVMDVDTSDATVESFMKKESYSKVAHPRVITTIPPTNRIKYSRFTYAFDAMLRD